MLVCYVCLLFPVPLFEKEGNSQVILYRHKIRIEKHSFHFLSSSAFDENSIGVLKFSSFKQYAGGLIVLPDDNPPLNVVLEYWPSHNKKIDIRNSIKKAKRNPQE